MRILLIGSNGQVGFELVRTLQPLGKLLATNRAGECSSCVACAPLDLADFTRLQRLIREYRPQLIVNAAAYTAVDRAEEERSTAFLVNSKAAGVMAEQALKQRALLVHFSTDYVFDGEATEPYLESDKTAPLGVYGESKLDGENRIIESGCDHLIFRTSWVYGNRSPNFLHTMLKLASQRDELSVVYDQLGAPTWSRQIAQQVAALLARLSPLSRGLAWEELLAGRGGIYHLTASGETSWHGFADELLTVAARMELIDRLPKIIAIKSEAYPTAARRPSYSVLNNEKLSETFALRPTCWEEALGLCLQEMKVSG